MQPEMEGMKPQFHPHPHHPISLPLAPPPRHHRDHHHHPLLHFHTPSFLHFPCGCPPFLLIPCHDHHHQPRCTLPFDPSSSNLSCPTCSPIPPAVHSSQAIQNPCPIASKPAGVETLEVSEAQTMESSARGLQQQEWRDDEELEDEEDVVFVLTDEWKEFFAKSEAKRRLAKQRKKKGGK